MRGREWLGVMTSGGRRGVWVCRRRYQLAARVEGFRRDGRPLDGGCTQEGLDSAREASQFSAGAVLRSWRYLVAVSSSSVSVGCGGGGLGQ